MAQFSPSLFFVFSYRLKCLSFYKINYQCTKLSQKPIHLMVPSYGRKFGAGISPPPSPHVRKRVNIWITEYKCFSYWFYWFYTLKLYLCHAPHFYPTLFNSFHHVLLHHLRICSCTYLGPKTNYFKRFFFEVIILNFFLEYILSGFYHISMEDCSSYCVWADN